MTYCAKIRGAVDSCVWLEDSEDVIESITREYSCIEREGLCEAEFASYAKETIFRTDPRALSLAKSKRCWRTKRMVELVAKPNQTFWEMPPLVDSSTAGSDNPNIFYDFDVRPDCAYWLSLEAINPEYLSQISEWSFVQKRRITWPYLTIEFKKDDSAGDSTESQVAAAGSVALYNRFCLRQQRLKMAGNFWTQKLTKELKHYGLTMEGIYFTIWCIKPVLTPNFEWGGCRMTRLSWGDCTMHYDAKNLLNWINEIHSWGLTIHGLRCPKDVKICMGERPSGSRVSFIPRDSEDDSVED